MNYFKICMLLLGIHFCSLPVLAQDQTVILIRHAEKALNGGTDPGLSEQGQQRANHLIELFNRLNPAAIYTTQYQRTQRTGQPLATALNIQLTILAIDTDNTAQYPALLLERICALPKNSNALVIGHSNSIPAIFEAWTHDSVKPIKDDEFDRLFLVKLSNCQEIGYLDIRY